MAINRSSLSPEIAALRPTGAKTLCRAVPDTETTVGGILVPAYVSGGMYATKEVVAVGPECSIFHPGMRGLVPRQSAHPKVDSNGEILEIIPEDHFHAAVGDALPPDGQPAIFLLPITNTVRSEFPLYEVCDALKAEVGDTLSITVRKGQR